MVGVQSQLIYLGTSSCISIGTKPKKKGKSGSGSPEANFSIEGHLLTTKQCLFNTMAYADFNIVQCIINKKDVLRYVPGSSCKNIQVRHINIEMISLCVDREMRDKMWKTQEGLWQCSDCNYTSQQPTNMRNHIEVHHMTSQGYYCQHCDKFCRTKNALSLHRSRYKHY